MSQKEEKMIGKFIHEKIPITWMRYNMFSSEDIYKNIPLLVFRVSNTGIDGKMKMLEKCVASFEGKNAWKVFKDPLSRKGNYLLTLAFVENMRKECQEKKTVYNEQKYLGNDKYKWYCEQAIQDIPLLAKHIEKCFGQLEIMK